MDDEKKVELGNEGGGKRRGKGRPGEFSQEEMGTEKIENEE